MTRQEVIERIEEKWPGDLSDYGRERLNELLLRYGEAIRQDCACAAVIAPMGVQGRKDIHDYILQVGV